MRRTRLVLSRKPGERVILELPDGRRVDVELVTAVDGKSRLLFEAPEDVRIWRGELGGFRRGAA